MKLNASRPRQGMKRLAQAGRLSYHLGRDGIRFWRYSALSVYDVSHEQLFARIMYNVHALEKGMAQTGTWQPGRGRRALMNLNDAMVLYARMGYDQSGFAYQEGISIIQRYLERHRGHKDAVAFLPQLMDPRLVELSESAPSNLAGTKLIHRSDKTRNDIKPFYELAQGRSSVRDFSGRPIDTLSVDRALRNAEKTPSVCNRQGWRVYWTEDKQLARSVLRHQRGFDRPQMPEVLLAVTVSNSTFISPVERNQGFVDGGLYAMSVLYGLESEGLAVVPLNACLYARDRRAVTRLLDIDPSEEIIMFIAIGDLPDESIVPVSDRRPTETYLRKRRGEAASADT